MKKILITISLIPMLSCGLKKDLATANETNKVLTEKIEELKEINENYQSNLEYNKIKIRELDFSLEKCERSKKQQENYFEEFKKQVPSNVLKEIEQRELKEDEERIAKLIKNSKNEVFTVVEQMPEFPGGMQPMQEFLAKNLKFPEEAKTNGIKGKVYLKFVVEIDGSITNIEVARGLGSGCDEESIRVIKLMPKWMPGKQRGKPVRCSYFLPISFYQR